MMNSCCGMSPMMGMHPMMAIGQLMGLMQMMMMMSQMMGGGHGGCHQMPYNPMYGMNNMVGSPSGCGCSPYSSYPQPGGSYPPYSAPTHGGNFNAGPPSQYDPIIMQAARTHGVDPALIKAVIKQESGGRNGLVSSAGAGGLMQLMPATARSLGCQNVMDPQQNIMAGTKYLAQQLKRYNGNVRLALAAYNAGPGNVNKYGGVPPFRETQNYVARITQNYSQMTGQYV